MYSCTFPRTISSNTSYVALDGLTVSVILFLMVVSPSFVDCKFNLKRIHRLLSIYTLFDYTPSQKSEGAEGCPGSLSSMGISTWKCCPATTKTVQISN